MLYVACFVVAMIIAVLLLPLLIKWSIPLGLVDVPNERKVHQIQVPRVGGIAIALGALFPIMLWVGHSTEMLGFLLAALFILFFGIWDDRSELNYKLKFLGQILAITTFIMVGDIYIQWLPFNGLSIAPLWLSLLLTFVALLGITNAVNLVDGLDGLAGGTSLLSMAAIGYLGFLSEDYDLVLFSLAICGSIFGFLRYNTHPAIIFMGDTGSQFLGLSIGVAAVLLTQRADTALSPMLPIILLGLPILDTLTVMTRRILNGTSPFSADKNHFHHRLMGLGLKHYEAVIAIYCIQVSIIILGISMRYQSDAVLLSVFIIFSLGFNLLLKHFETSGWRFNHSHLANYLQKARCYQNLRKHPDKLILSLRKFIMLSLPLYLLICVWSGRHTEGIVWLYGGMMVWSLALLISPAISSKSMLSRFVWYAACGLGVYAAGVSGFLSETFSFLYIGMLSVIILLCFILDKGSSFTANPLDIIVLFFVCSMFYLSRLDDGYSIFGLQFTQIIVFLYAVEFMLEGDSESRKFSNIFLVSIFSIVTLFSIN